MLVLEELLEARVLLELARVEELDLTEDELCELELESRVDEELLVLVEKREDEEVDSLELDVEREEEVLLAVVVETRLEELVRTLDVDTMLLLEDEPSL